MVILGLNILHDATATLLVDGKIVASVAEERLTRVKFHCGFPYRSIEEVLRIAGITARQVDKVVFSFNSNLEKMPRYYTDYVVKRSGEFDTANEKDFNFRYRMLKDQALRRFHGDAWANGKNYALKQYRQALGAMGIDSATIETRDHHLCHAASAYYQGGRETALIVTGDGSGDGQSMGVFIGEGGRIRKLHSVSDRHSLGKFYSSVTKYLGFKRNRHEGKITGLAAYGDPHKHETTLKQMVNITEDLRDFCTPIAEEKTSKEILLTNVRHFLRGDYYGSHYSNLQLDYLQDVFKYRFHKGQVVSKPSRWQANGFCREDIAAAAQGVIEELAVRFIQQFLIETGMEHILLAGGIFANVKVNQRIAEIDGVESVFIHPNMGDGGTATGAAFLVWSEFLEAQNRVFEPETIEHVYYGTGFSEAEIVRALLSHSFPFRKSDDVEAETAELLSKKKVVGRFDGRMEYGPRALGNRSILADPTDQSINDWLNERLKRTEFMPFAPSVLHEAAPKLYKNYASGEYPSFFMTITFDVEPEWIARAPAVCHVDGTARPQVVKESANPSYYRILKEYEKRTGLPLLVNTSFNMHEEPIVCTPEDALRSFEIGCVDVLSIGPFLVWREGSVLP
ncbi:MAG: carbamoyltransferase C-terminal domain-containing protein [bacterium]